VKLSMSAVVMKTLGAATWLVVPLDTLAMLLIPVVVRLLLAPIAVGIVFPSRLC